MLFLDHEFNRNSKKQIGSKNTAFPEKPHTFTAINICFSILRNNEDGFVMNSVNVFKYGEWQIQPQ